MRSKLVVGGFAAAVAFLLATNPVVVEAAGQITSGMIKNGTIKSADVKNNGLKGKDIKDGSLTSADLAAGTIPTPTTTVKRLLVTTFVPINNTTGTLAFFGPTTTVTVDGNDAVSGDGYLWVDTATAGDDVTYAICSRPVGSAAAPVPLGGPTAVALDVDVIQFESALPLAGVDILPAGSHTIGVCTRNVAPSISAYVNATIMVQNSTGSLARPTGGTLGTVKER